MKLITFLSFILFSLFCQTAWACSVCFGDPSAPISQGLIMGVVTLLFIIGSVLAGFAYFIFHLWKKGKLANE